MRVGGGGPASGAPNDRSLFAGEAAMKKVRYVIGTVGVLGAVPALGLLTPATTAAAATHATPAGHSGRVAATHKVVITTNTATAASGIGANSTGTVALPSGSVRTAATAALRCAEDWTRSAKAGEGRNQFLGKVVFGTPTDEHCIYAMDGSINHSQTGLEMRARAYNGATMVYQKYVHGTIIPVESLTEFDITSIEVNATGACQALVYSTDTAKVAYGPVCEPTSPKT
jgi:hypothetical protein